MPVAFVVYDALYGDGRVLVEEPFAERRRLIDSLAYPSDSVRPAPSRRY